jgi:hypothetical protein
MPRPTLYAKGHQTPVGTDEIGGKEFTCYIQHAIHKGKAGSHFDREVSINILSRGEALANSHRSCWPC